jgi:hypothetical protein
VKVKRYKQRAECPYCGAGNDAFTDAYGHALPHAGDWSICFSCARVAVFTGQGLSVRRLTNEEEGQASASAELQRALNALRGFKNVTP